MCIRDRTLSGSILEGLRANDSGIYTKMQKLLLQGRSRAERIYGLACVRLGSRRRSVSYTHLAYEGSADADPYYIKKYEYLKKHNFFSTVDPVNFGKIDESVIKNNIAQVPQIVFETTDFCNLNCSYCVFGDFYEEFDVRNQKMINIDHAIILLKYLSLIHISLTKTSTIFLTNWITYQIYLLTLHFNIAGTGSLI